jgi:hypothetical protein
MFGITVSLMKLCDINFVETLKCNLCKNHSGTPRFCQNQYAFHLTYQLLQKSQLCRILCHYFQQIVEMPLVQLQYEIVTNSLGSFDQLRARTHTMKY